MTLLNDFLHFLDESPTSFHAADKIVQTLSHAGFAPLQEANRWSLQPGHAYFICKENSLVAAFRMPKKPPDSSVIIATHLDSPCLKIKPGIEPNVNEIGRLGTEIYGAPILHSWLDRELAIAGRILVENKSGKLATHLVHLPQYPLIIPQLALHLDRSAADKGFTVHKQDHLKPIFSLEAKEKNLERLLQKEYPLENLVGFDLFLVPSQKAALAGIDQELLAAYRLDNLTSSYAALFAMLHSHPREETLQIAFFWDHEEIGSMTQTGADSCFADQLLERIALGCGLNREDYFRYKAKSICISADLAHGFHPNFPDKYDLQNACFLGQGAVLKFHASQKYATSASGAAAICQLAAKHKLPLQKFSSRSDIPSGSTVGSMMAAQTGIATVDLGISSWAMHSARETIAAQDEITLCRLLEAAMKDLPIKEKS